MNLRFGVISEVKAEEGLARVRFQAEDDMVSYWLPMSMPKTLQDKFIIPYDVNEHVWCLMDENMEYGVIGGAIYDQGNQNTGGTAAKIRVQFVQGLCVEYSRNSKTLSISGPGDINIDINGTGKGKVNIKCNEAVIESLTTVEIKATTEIILNAPLVTVLGLLNAEQIAVSSGGVGNGNATVAGNFDVTGTITGGEVHEGVIRLGTHKHSGVTTGGGTSGTPIP
jgi:phage baseplate assembly protein V